MAFGHLRARVHSAGFRRRLEKACLPRRCERGSRKKKKKKENLWGFMCQNYDMIMWNAVFGDSGIMFEYLLVFFTVLLNLSIYTYTQALLDFALI